MLLILKRIILYSVVLVVLNLNTDTLCVCFDSLHSLSHTCTCCTVALVVLCSINKCGIQIVNHLLNIGLYGHNYTAASSVFIYCAYAVWCFFGQNAILRGFFAKQGKILLSILFSSFLGDYYTIN